MGNMRCDLRRPLECVRKRGSGFFEGSAVKLLQHTQLPFNRLFVQLVGKDGVAYC
jgi:hypothetical protein